MELPFSDRRKNTGGGLELEYQKFSVEYTKFKLPTRLKMEMESRQLNTGYEVRGDVQAMYFQVIRVTSGISNFKTCMRSSNWIIQSSSSDGFKTAGWHPRKGQARVGK